jgi:hypothetical protein
MDALSRDTDLAAEQVQIELLRRATTSQRFQCARSMSQTVIELSRRALRRQMPEHSEQEMLLRFVELNYGAELARGLRVHLEKTMR